MNKQIDQKKVFMVGAGIIVTGLIVALGLSLQGRNLQGYLGPNMGQNQNQPPQQNNSKVLTHEARPLTSEANPINPITRAQLAALIATNLPTAPKPNLKNCFPDTVGNKYESAICGLAKAGLIQGYPDGTFKPTNNVNRAEGAKLFATAFLANKPYQNTQNYVDVHSNDWYYTYVIKMVSSKIGDVAPGKGSYFHPANLLLLGTAELWITQIQQNGLGRSNIP